MSIIDSINLMSPTQFENLVYDLVVYSGGLNARWRTPGADTGRDIEALVRYEDFSGNVASQKWYIECKKYSNSIDWPTVWRKISYADSQSCDYLLVATNSNPSPNCETEISNWNNGKRYPQIRFWRGYDIERLVSLHPSVAAKHGLTPHSSSAQAFSVLTIDLMKVSQAAYMSLQTGGNPLPALEASSAVSELLSLRMSQIESKGGIYRSALPWAAPEYEWLAWDGNIPNCDEEGMRAVLCYVRYISGATALTCSVEGGSFTLLPQIPKRTIAGSGLRTLTEIALWANFEVRSVESGNIKIEVRE